MSKRQVRARLSAWKWKKKGGGSCRGSDPASILGATTQEAPLLHAQWKPSAFSKLCVPQWGGVSRPPVMGQKGSLEKARILNGKSVWGARWHVATQVRFQFGLDCQMVPGGESLMKRRLWEGPSPPPGHPSWLGWGLSYRLTPVFPHTYLDDSTQRLKGKWVLWKNELKQVANPATKWSSQRGSFLLQRERLRSCKARCWWLNFLCVFASVGNTPVFSRLARGGWCLQP